MTGILSTFTNKELSARLHAAQMNATGLVDCVFKNFDQEFKAVTSNLTLTISAGACSIGSRTGQLIESKHEILPPNVKFRVIAEIALGSGGEFKVFIENDAKKPLAPLVQNDFQSTPLGRRQMLLWEGNSTNNAINLVDKRSFDTEFEKKAQMQKITENSGSAWRLKEGDTLTSYLIQQGMGVRHIYVIAKVGDAPNDVAGTGIFNIYSASTTAIYGHAYFVSGGKMFYQYINGTVKRESWQPVASETKVQMQKITKDNGTAYLIGNGGDFSTITQMIKTIDPGLYAINVFAQTIDKPGGTANQSSWFGTLEKPHNSGATVFLNEYGNSRKTATVNYSTSTITEQNLLAQWKIMATEEQVKLKADSSKTQLQKITADNGGTIETLSTGSSFSEYVKKSPLGMRSIYFASGILDLPYTGSGRIIYHKTNSNTDTNPYGIGWGILFSGEYVQTIHWWGKDAYAPVAGNWKPISKIYSGKTVPANSLGFNGDVYIQYI